MVGGLAAGSVKEIGLGEDGEAEVKITVSEDFAPLPTGHDGHDPPGLAFLGRRAPGPAHAAPGGRRRRRARSRTAAR